MSWIKRKIKQADMDERFAHQLMINHILSERIRELEEHADWCLKHITELRDLWQAEQAANKLRLKELREMQTIINILTNKQDASK